MAGSYRFIDVPPPDVHWVPLGPAGPEANALDDDVQGSAEADAPKLANRAVAVGDRVGQGVVGLPGRTGRIARRQDASGRHVWAAPVLTDDDAELATTPFLPEDQLPPARREALDAWLTRLAAAGVRPSRVNSPDLVEQLLATREEPAEAVLCSCLEPDPLLPLQYEWAARHPRALRDGLRLIAKLSGAPFVSVAVSSYRHRRFARLLRGVEAGRPVASADDVPAGDGTDGIADEQAAREAEAIRIGRIRLVPVLNAYPQGDPTLLTHTLAGRRLRPDSLPTEAGVIVIDAVTAVAVGFVANGCGVVRREPLGLRDHRRDIGVLAEAWRGTRLIDVLLFLGMLARDPERGDGNVPDRADQPAVIAGDFLRDKRCDLGTVVGDGELIFHRVEATAVADAQPCIRCGWCLDICPTSLNPVGLLDAEATSGPRRVRLAERYGADRCVGCGLCDHACPSDLALKDVALKMRDELALAKRHEQAATRPVRPIVRPRGARTIYDLRGGGS